MKKNRRNFIKKAIMSTVALSSYSFANSLSAKSYRKIIGSNDRINIAVQGLGRRGPGLLYNALSCENIELTWISDVMDKQIEKEIEAGIIVDPKLMNLEQGAAAEEPAPEQGGSSGDLGTQVMEPEAGEI